MTDQLTLELPIGNVSAEDRIRLRGQAARVWAYMLDGEPHTIPEIAEACSASHTGASARLRDFRKFGHTVKRWPDKDTPGLHWYQLAWINPRVQMEIDE